MKKILKVFILLVYTLLITGNVQAKDISFVQVTDVHYNETNKQMLNKAVNDINNLENVDFVIFTGDNIDVSKRTYLDGFLKDVKQLHVPYYILVGNHDVYKRGGVSTDEYMQIVRKSVGPLHPGTSNYVFKKNGYVFIVVNGAKDVIPGAGGYFKAGTLSWLDSNLTKYKDYPVIIFQHFPLLDASSSGHEVYNKVEYLELLKRHHNVKALIAGHYHQNREEMQNGVYHVITPALAYSGTYKVVDIDTSINFVYTMLKKVE